MLRTALEVFIFKPRREETIQMAIMRFDLNCEKVKDAARFQLSYELRAFWLMCI